MKILFPTVTLAVLLGLSSQSPAQDDRKRPDWDSLKKRIEGAVERGDLTRDQAKQKYLEMKKKMAPQRPKAQTDRAMPKDQPFDALGKVLGTLVQQGKIDRADVARIRQAAMASRPPMRPNLKPMPNKGPRPGLSDHPKNEMPRLLEAAKRELAQIREIRINLQQTHHHHEMEMAERRLMAERRELEEERETMEREREGHAEREHGMRERAEAQRREEIEKARNAARREAEAKRQAAQREQRARSTEKKPQVTRERREQ